MLINIQYFILIFKSKFIEAQKRITVVIQNP